MVEPPYKPEKAAKGILLLFGDLFSLLDDFGERCWFVDCEIGEDFAVDLDVVLFHAIYELAVTEAVFACGIVDAGDPESAQVALAITTVTVGITQGLDDSLFC